MSNVRDITEGRIVRSLAFVFEQLERIGVKKAGQVLRLKPHPLTRSERAFIQEQLRRDLKASWDLCKPKAKNDDNT